MSSNHIHSDNPADFPDAVLVADLGCTLCSHLAASAHELSKGRVVVRGLSDPNLPEVARTMLDDRTEPLLYSLSGDRVKVWRGLGLRLRLAGLLGPVASAQLLAKVAVAVTANEDVRAVRAAAPRLNRRQLLGAGGSLALGAAAIGVLPAGVAGASTPPASGSSPASDSLALLTASPIWSQAETLARTDGLVRDPGLDTTTVRASQFAAVQSVWRPTRGTDKAMATIGLIDLTTKTVPYLRSVRIMSASHATQLRVNDQTGTLFDIDVVATNPGNQRIVVRSPKRGTLFEAMVDEAGMVHPAPGYETVWKSLNTRMTAHSGPQPDLFGFSFCDFAVGLLCGAGTGGGCAALAIALGITTLGAGIGAGVVCAIIAFFGCSEAMCIICGC
jgi:hypothetical protein